MEITYDPTKNATNEANSEWVDDENPEWTDANFARAKPASEVLPALFGTQAAQAMLKPREQPSTKAAKERITIRFDPDVLEALRATGRGWQARLNELARREFVGTRSPV